LSKLTKVPFETMKYQAKDVSWMQSDTNGDDLINKRRTSVMIVMRTY